MSEPPAARRIEPLAVLLLAASLGIGVLLAGPALLEPASRVPVTRFTEGQFINLALGAHELPWPTSTRLLGWPEVARFSPLLLPFVLLAAAFGPTVALNGCFFLMPALNACGGWTLARVSGGGPAAAFVAGALTAWNPWVLNTAANGQLEQVPVGGAALAWAAAIWAAERPSRAWAPGLVTLLVATSAPHVGLATMVGFVPLGLLGVLGRLGRPRAWWAMAPGLLLAVGLAHAWHAPQFGEGTHVYAPKGAVTGGGAGSVLPGIFEVATPARLLLPPEPPDPRAQGVVHVVYLGWVTLLAAGLATARQPGARPWALVGGLLGIAACGERLELGSVSIPLPAALYGQLSEALSRSANPYRLVAGVVPALAVAAGLLVQRPRGALVLVALAWLETGWTRTRGLPLPTQAWEAEPAALALRGGEGPVLDVPLASPACPDANWHYATQAMYSGRPVPLTLRFDWRAWGELAGDARWMLRALDAPDCGVLLGPRVRELGFTAVVLHDDARCAVPPGARACLEAAFGPGRREGSTTWWEPR